MGSVELEAFLADLVLGKTLPTPQSQLPVAGALSARHRPRFPRRGMLPVARKRDSSLRESCSGDQNKIAPPGEVGFCAATLDSPGGKDCLRTPGRIPRPGKAMRGPGSSLTRRWRPRAQRRSRIFAGAGVAAEAGKRDSAVVLRVAWPRCRPSFHPDDGMTAGCRHSLGGARR